jgi:hypothetical protein
MITIPNQSSVAKAFLEFDEPLISPQLSPEHRLNQLPAPYRGPKTASIALR